VDAASGANVPRPQILTASLVRSTPVRRLYVSSSVDCFQLNVLAVFVDAGFDPVLDVFRIVGVSCVVRATGTTPAASRWSCQPACRRRCLQASDRFLDGERVTRDAHRRLLWRLLALGELRGNQDLLPGRDDRTAVAVVVLFGGWIVAFRRVLSAGIVLTSVESMGRSSRAGRGRRRARLSRVPEPRRRRVRGR